MPIFVFLTIILLHYAFQILCMMFHRDLLDTLSAKVTTQDLRPVVIRGVRGSGKSTLGEIFAKQFAQSMEFDLSKPADRKAFEKPSSGPFTYSGLFFLRNRYLSAGRTLLFLDNLQDMPEALGRVMEAPDRPEHLVVMGAAEGIRDTGYGMRDMESGISRTGYPASQILRPLSFREFLLATGESDALSQYLDVPCPDHAHGRLLKLFHRYALTGGMPEAVSAWLESHSIHAVEKVFEHILDSWKELLGQQASGNTSFRNAFHVLVDAFPYAASRIKFHHFGNRPLASREASAAFRLLEELGFLSLVHPATGTVPDDPPDTGRSPRLQFADTGMVTCFSGIRNAVNESEDLTVLFGGQILRHIAGQELLSVPDARPGLSFWTRSKNQSSAETEFTIEYRGMRIPVAARSGEPGRLRGLHQFIDAAPHPYAVRLCSDRLHVRKTKTLAGKDYYLLSLPYYLAARIPEHLDGFVRLVEA
jgi:predicted AAA+ superfamily ATPase